MFQTFLLTSRGIDFLLRYLAYPISIILVTIASVTAQVEKREESEEEIKQRFRTSLERLKWNAKMQRAVEKSPPRKSKRINTGETSEQGKIQINTALVINEVIVTDEQGKMINDLKQGDFIIIENQKHETIEVFSPSKDPSRSLSIILILELSDHIEIRFTETLDAAQQLIDLLDTNDRLAIVNDDIELLTSYTRDKGKLKNIIGQYQKMLKAGQRWSPEGKINGGEARHMDSLMASLRELSK